MTTEKTWGTPPIIVDCCVANGGQTAPTFYDDAGRERRGLIVCSKYVVCDRLGWPVELIRGRPITNLLRKIIHGRSIRRWTGVGDFDARGEE